MEAFLYQQLQFSLLDPLYLSNSPVHQNRELSNASSCFTNAYNSRQEASTVSSLGDAMQLPEPQVSSSEKKRKQSENNGSCLTTGHLKGARKTRSRRKKLNGASKVTEEEKQPKATNNEPPTRYIHVRARRGQATDSHSLAERVRRERISERMKKLQGLVPGCDKVIGKALILDEIINYVQSLQNQVEFLSMKIASVNPIINFGVDFEDPMMQPEGVGTFEGAANNLQVTDSLSSVLPLPGHLGSAAFSQGSSSFLMQMDDSRRGLPTQVELKNMFCYQ